MAGVMAMEGTVRVAAEAQLESAKSRISELEAYVREQELKHSEQLRQASAENRIVENTKYKEVDELHAEINRLDDENFKLTREIRSKDHLIGLKANHARKWEESFGNLRYPRTESGSQGSLGHPTEDTLKNKWQGLQRHVADCFRRNEMLNESTTVLRACAMKLLELVFKSSEMWPDFDREHNRILEMDLRNLYTSTGKAFLHIRYLELLSLIYNQEILIQFARKRPCCTSRRYSL
jgi:hypothetical protein